jgi:hypothetical protein
MDSPSEHANRSAFRGSKMLKPEQNIPIEVKTCRMILVLQ